MADGAARAKVLGHFRTAFAVGGQVVAEELEVNIMQQTGQTPLVFIFVEAFGEGAHDSFGSQHVADQVFVFNILAD
jgi:hypothetical protein